MAWVPNASAMQIAEPWKPLPPPEEEKKGAGPGPTGQPVETGGCWEMLGDAGAWG